MEQPFRPLGNELGQARSAAIVGHRRHDSSWFVQHEHHELLVAGDQRAVEADLVRGSDPGALLGHDAAVDLDPTAVDQDLAAAATAQPGSGQDFLQPLWFSR